MLKERGWVAALAVATAVPCALGAGDVVLSTEAGTHLEVFDDGSALLLIHGEPIDVMRTGHDADGRFWVIALPEEMEQVGGSAAVRQGERNAAKRGGDDLLLWMKEAQVSAIAISVDHHPMMQGAYAVEFSYYNAGLIGTHRVAVNDAGVLLAAAEKCECADTSGMICEAKHCDQDEPPICGVFHPDERCKLVPAFTY